LQFGSREPTKIFGKFMMFSRIKQEKYKKLYSWCKYCPNYKCYYPNTDRNAFPVLFSKI